MPPDLFCKQPLQCGPKAREQCQGTLQGHCQRDWPRKMAADQRNVLHFPPDRRLTAPCSSPAIRCLAQLTPAP